MTSFQANTEELRNAANQMSSLWWRAGLEGFSSVSSDHDTVGHDGLAQALGTFSSRWTNGVWILAKDLNSLARTVDDAATTYERQDEELSKGMVIAPGEYGTGSSSGGLA